MREGSSIETKRKKNIQKHLERVEWDRFLKAAVNVAAPFIGMAGAAKIKNP